MRNEGDVHKYLDFLQQTIGRMASMSLQVKTWSVGLISGILALAASENGDPKLIAIAFFPALILWCLDAYYLEQERRFRWLYDAALGNQGPVTFLMDPTRVPPSPELGPLQVFFSSTLLMFHGLAIGGVVLAFIVLRRLGA